MRQALHSCDAVDQVTDGIITDPRRCNFDPSTLLCRAGDAPTCLTRPQVDAVKKIYGGPRNPRTGELLYAGYSPGSELDCAPLVIGSPVEEGSAPAPAFVDIIRIFAFQNPNYDWRAFDFDRDMASVDTKIGPIVNALAPDLSAFKTARGKIILYHGWADQYVSPQDGMNYYEKMVSFMGRNGDKGLAKTQEFARLFMAPGVKHCSGGPGPNSFGNAPKPGTPQDAEHDAFTALVQWVERGIAPNKIIATKYVNDDPAKGVIMTRPLCPHPEIAVYSGRETSTTAPTSRVASLTSVKVAGRSLAFVRAFSTCT